MGEVGARPCSARSGARFSSLRRIAALLPRRAVFIFPPHGIFPEHPAAGGRALRTLGGWMRAARGAARGGGDGGVAARDRAAQARAARAGDDEVQHRVRLRASGRRAVGTGSARGAGRARAARRTARRAHARGGVRGLRFRDRSGGDARGAGNGGGAGQDVADRGSRFRFLRSGAGPDGPAPRGGVAAGGDAGAECGRAGRRRAHRLLAGRRAALPRAGFRLGRVAHGDGVRDPGGGPALRGAGGRGGAARALAGDRPGALAGLRRADPPARSDRHRVHGAAATHRRPCGRAGRYRTAAQCGGAADRGAQPRLRAGGAGAPQRRSRGVAEDGEGCG